MENNATTQVHASTLPQNTTVKKSKYKKTIILVISILIFAFLVGMIVSYFLDLKKAKLPNQSASKKITVTNTLPTNHSTKGPYKYGDADSNNVSLKVERVIPNPPSKGDPPDPGREYLEIDMTVTYNGTTAGSVPGIFMYKDGSGNLVTSADVHGSGKYSNKNVNIPNKWSLYAVELYPGKTVTGVYLLYQVVPGDKGSLVWDNPAASTDKKRTTLKLF